MDTKRSTLKVGAACLVVGLFAGPIVCLSAFGWQTAGSAAADKANAVRAAYTTAYAPVCARHFDAKATADQKAAFVKASDWDRPGLIRQDGFATPVGLKAPPDGIASACADALTAELKSADATNGAAKS